MAAKLVDGACRRMPSAEPPVLRLRVVSGLMLQTRTRKMQLKSVGCQYVVIGHSERRHGNCASENDAVFRMKVCLPSNFHSSLCD